MNLMIAGAAILLAALTSGCASKSDKVTCNSRDWYETGRHHGAQGSTMDALDKLKNECGRSFEAAWETIYINGRNAGLVDYCAPENSFELGRMGISYHYVCPSTVEPAFLAGYRKGQKARTIELENQKLDAQIDTLANKLNKADSTYERRQLASVIEDLRKTREKNDREREKTSN